MADGRTNKLHTNHISEKQSSAGKSRIHSQVLTEPVLRALGIEPSRNRQFVQAINAFESDPAGPGAGFLLKQISNSLMSLVQEQRTIPFTCIEGNVELLTAAAAKVQNPEARATAAEDVADMLMELSCELEDDDHKRNIAFHASLLVPLFSNERLGGYIQTSVAEFENDPAGCEAAQHLKTAAGYTAHTDDKGEIAQAIKRILRPMEKIDDPELNMIAAKNVAQGLIHIAAEVADEKPKGGVIELIQEELRLHPAARDGMIDFLKEYEHDPEHDESQVCILEVAFDILQPGRDALLEIFEFDSPHIKLIAERRINELEEKNRRMFVQEFGFTVFGKIVSTAELFDLSECDLPDAGYYDLDRVMSEEWRKEFKRVMANRPDSALGDQMLRMLLTDAIGTHLDPDRIDQCLSILEEAFENTTTTGAKTIALTMAALVSKLEPGGLKVQLDKRIQPALESQTETIAELHKQLKDLAMFESLFLTMFDALPEPEFNQVVEAEKQLKKKEAAKQEFCWHFMLRENRHLIRINSDENRVSVLALGDVAVEVITEDRKDVDEALHCMKERFGPECVSIVDHKDGEKSRYLIYRPFEADKTQELSRFYAGTIRAEKIAELHTRSVANFRDQPASKLEEEVVDRIAGSEHHIRFKRLMREDPESAEASRMIQDTLKHALSPGAPSENIDHVFSSFAQAFRDASPRGQEKIAIAVAFLYLRIQHEGLKSGLAARAETLLSTVEDPRTFLRHVGEQTTREEIHETLCGFLQRRLEAAREEERTPEEKAKEFGTALNEFRILSDTKGVTYTFDQIFDFASQVRTKPPGERHTALERSVIRLDNAYSDLDDDQSKTEAAKEIISYSLKEFERDVASPDAESNLRTICSQAALIEDSEFLRLTVGGLLGSVGNQTDKTAKDAAAGKVARCMIDLAAEVKEAHKDDVSNCIRANLPLLSATTRNRMIDILTASECVHDSPDKRDLLVFGLADPKPKELEEILEGEANDYVKQVAATRLDKLWIAEFSEIMQKKPDSDEAQAMLSALVQATTEDQSQERLDSTISILTDALEKTGEVGIVRIAQTAATLHSQLDGKDLRWQLSESLGRFLVDEHPQVIIPLLKDADEKEYDALCRFMERYIPVEVRSEIKSVRDEKRNATLREAEIGPGDVGEDIERVVAGLQIVSEEPPKAFDFDMTDPRIMTSEYNIFVTLERFIANPAGPDALEDLEHVAQNIEMLDSEQSIISIIKKVLSAPENATEEEKTIVYTNIARGLLSIVECLNPQLRNDIIPNIQRSVQDSIDLRSAMLGVLEKTECTAEDSGKDLLVFSLVQPKPEELDELRRNASSQYVRQYADSQWTYYFLGVMRESPVSEEAAGLLKKLSSVSKEPEELERVKLLLIDAFGQTSDKGRSKIALTTASIYSKLDPGEQSVFSDEVGAVFAEPEHLDAMKSLLSKTRNDRPFNLLLGIMERHLSAQDLEEIRSARALDRKWVDSAHPLVSGVPPDLSEVTDPNMDLAAIMAQHMQMNRVAEPVLSTDLVKAEEQVFFERLSFFRGDPGSKDVKIALENAVNHLSSPETRLETVIGASDAIIRRAGEFAPEHIVEARQIAFSAIFGIVFKSRREAVETSLEIKLEHIWDSLSFDEQDALLGYYCSVLLKVPKKTRNETEQQTAKREEREERGIYIYRFLRKNDYVPEDHWMHSELIKRKVNDRIKSEAVKVRDRQVTRAHVIDTGDSFAQPAVSQEQAVVVDPSLELEYLKPFEDRIAQEMKEYEGCGITSDELKIAIDRMLRRYGENQVNTDKLAKEAKRWIKNREFVGLAADLYSIFKEEDPTKYVGLVADLRSIEIRNKKLERMVDDCLKNMGAIPKDDD